MAEPPGGDKTEAPTEKRKRDAAAKGERPDAREAGVALVTAGGALWMLFAGAALVDALGQAVRGGLSFGRAEVDGFHPLAKVAALATPILMPLAGLFAVTVAAAIVAAFLTGGGSFTAARFLPKLERLDPIAGFGRLFGGQALTELMKALLKVAVTLTVAILALRSLRDDALALGRADPAAAIAFLGDRAAHLMLLLAGGLVLIAIVDAPIAIVRFMRRLRMTKQEVRQEMKEQEGSPELRSALRARQREAARAGARQAVAAADVVITNPTQFAIALRYRRDRDRAPIVVARGRGELAAVIRAAAREAGVHLLDYPELARALYYTSRRDGEIAPDLYVAVAAVLAFVYSLGRPGLRPKAPAVEVPPGLRFDEHGRRMA